MIAPTNRLAGVIKGRRLGPALFSLLTALTVLSFVVMSGIQAPLARAASTIYVSTTGNDTTGNGSATAPYRTILHGLSMAVSGDTVQVAGGTYNERVNLKSGVTLLGTGSPTIDAGLTGVAVTASNVTTATISGFNIMNGESLTQGGGIYVTGSTGVTIQNNTILNNITQGSVSNGGGILVIDSSVSILNNTIQDNTADSSGGGLYLQLTSQAATIRGNLILGNTTNVGNGGGIGVSLGNTGSVQITNNQILSNCANDSGAGIYVEGSGSGNILANLIESGYTNDSVNGGVGMFVQGNVGETLALLIADNIIDSNAASGLTATGGGILIGNGVGSVTYVVNNTVYNNSAVEAGGIGVYYAAGPTLPASTPTIGNNIIYGNINAQGSADDLLGVFIDAGALGATSDVAASYNLIGSGTGATGKGNITGNPLFVNAPSDFHLQAGSPAINTGDNALVPAQLTTDYDGRPRIMGGVVDMGAYEVIAGVTYIITASAGSGGVIQPSGLIPINAGGNQTFFIAPDPDYQIVGVTVDGVQVGAIGSYTFTDVQANHTISAEFAQVTTYTIVASAGANGSISPSGTIVAQLGQTITFIVTPDKGYHIASIIVDGINVGDTNSHTFNDISANHTISANFAINQYTITATAGPNGTISPAGVVTLNYNTNQAYVIAPNPGCYVSDVLVDGISVGPVTGYTFSAVDANHTIDAVFAVNTYKISATAGPNGTVAPSGTVTVTYGGSQTFTFTPSTGYHVANVTLDGTSVGPVGSYTLNNVTADHAIAVTFAINTYTLTVSAGSNGSITPSGTLTVNYGAAQTFTITPNAHYHIADVRLDGVSVGPVSSYTLNNITADHTLVASFAIDTNIISVGAVVNGSITPSGNVAVPYGGSQTFAITPATGYQVLNVLVDGAWIGAMPSYTFNNVTGPHSISASFAIRTYTISASAGANGSILPSGNVQLPYMGSQTFTITPDEGYRVADVLVDGHSVGAQASYTFSTISADHTIAASFAPNVIPVTITLGNLNPTYDGTPKSVTVTTDPAGISVSVTYNGQAQAPTNAGSYAVAVSVTDPNYSGSASGTLTIAKAAATVTLASSANPSVVGQAVTFTAAVSSTAGTPSGTVQFSVDGTPLGAPVTVSGGSASSGALSSMAVGSHTVTASYSGDANFNVADASPLTQTAQGPRNLKLQAVNLLTPYTDESHRIDNAIEYINDSLDTDLWVDATHVDPQHGQQVFDGERHAVQELMHLVKNDDHKPVSAGALAASQQAINALVEADRLIAVTLINDATAATVLDPSHQSQVASELAQASSALQQGDAERDSADYDNAIDKYADAWRHAGNAISLAAQAPSQNQPDVKDKGKSKPAAQNDKHGDDQSDKNNGSGQQNGGKGTAGNSGQSNDSSGKQTDNGRNNDKSDDGSHGNGGQSNNAGKGASK